MRHDVKRNWAWADQYLPDVKRILMANAGHMLDICIAPLDADMNRATDMVVSVKGGDVAVRVRRPRYNYRDLTIRARAGGKTEIDKIREGFARWYLYGWTNGDGRLAEWMLVDLDKVREHELLSGRRVIDNRDGRTGFIAIPAEELLAKGCIVAHHVPKLKRPERAIVAKEKAA